MLGLSWGLLSTCQTSQEHVRPLFPGKAFYHFRIICSWSVLSMRARGVWVAVNLEIFLGGLSSADWWNFWTKKALFFHQPDSQDGSARTLVYFGFSVDFIPWFDHFISWTPISLRIFVMIVIEVLSGKSGAEVKWTGHIALSKRPIKLFQLDQQSRRQALRDYCCQESIIHYILLS